MSRDYWPSDASADVNLLESRAFLNALVSFKSQLLNSRVDVHIDNKVLKSALDDDGCRNSAINEVIKEIYRDQNFSIQTFYVPSSHDPADEPSREVFGFGLYAFCWRLAIFGTFVRSSFIRFDVLEQ